MRTSQAHARRGRVATIGAVVLVAIGAGLLAAALLTRASTPSGRAASTPPGASAHPLFVATRNCDDARPAEVARHSATPWCTLRRAAEAAPANSEVRIEAGNYGSLALKGGPGGLASNVTFRAQDPRARPQVQALTMSGVSGTTFREFLFTGTVNLIGTSGVTIKNNGFAGSNLYLRETARSSVIDNRFRRVHSGQRALLAQSSGAPGKPITTDLVVRGNLFDDIRHDAIAVYNGYRNVTVERNRIRGVVRMPGFPFHSDGMQFMGGDSLTVRDNVLYDDQAGILVKDGRASTHLVVEGNLITGSPRGAGMQIFNAPGAVVRHNTIWGTAYGTIFSNDLKIAGRTSVKLEANVLDQLIVNGVEQARLTSAANNVFGQGRAYGRPAYRGRPNFVNARARDLRIRSASPGAGLPKHRTPPGAQLRVAP